MLSTIQNLSAEKNFILRMANTNRYSVGSLASLGCSSTSVDASFVSLASTSSSSSNGYEIESEVGREALKEICCSALSRVLDFPDCQLETLLGYDEETGGRGDDGGTNVAKNITAFMKRGLSAISHKYHSHHQSHERINEDSDSNSLMITFGVPLSTDGQIVLLQLITHIHTYSTTVGIFRKSGNKCRIEKMIRDLGERPLSEIISSGKYNPHDFASVLKQYFAELPEPILMKRHLDAYLQASDLSSFSSITRSLQLLMLLLPPTHRVVLQHMLDLLSQITKCHENKMDAHSLALIFAPTLFLASRTDLVQPTSLENLSSLLKYMIDNNDEIFEVPAEVQVVAERYCRRRKNCRKSDEDIPLEQYSTFCKRESPEDFHKSGQARAQAEVASLLEMVKNMPDGPQKTHFLKRFESASHLTGTPSTSRHKFSFSTSKLRRSRKHNENKENATPQVKKSQQSMKPCFKKGSLMPEFDLADHDNEEQTPSVKRVRILTDSPMITEV